MGSAEHHKHIGDGLPSGDNHQRSQLLELELDKDLHRYGSLGEYDLHVLSESDKWFWAITYIDNDHRHDHIDIDITPPRELEHTFGHIA